MITYEQIQAASNEPLPVDIMGISAVGQSREGFLQNATKLTITSVEPNVDSSFSVTLDAKAYLKLSPKRIPRKVKKHFKKTNKPFYSQKVKIIRNEKD